MPHRPAERRPRTGRRLVTIAVGVSVLVHAVILGLVVLRPPADTGGPRSIVLLPVRPESADLPSVRPDAPAEPASEAGERPAPSVAQAPRPVERPPVVGVPTPRPGAPDTATIPETGLVELRAPMQPLVATPYGVARRPVVRDEARLARVRAESLVNARIASILERPPSTLQAGPVSLANGGVSVPVPWQGFVRDDRDDATWREKRCRGEEKDGGEGAGEDEARRSQCG